MAAGYFMIFYLRETSFQKTLLKYLWIMINVVPSPKIPVMKMGEMCDLLMYQQTSEINIILAPFS